MHSSLDFLGCEKNLCVVYLADKSLLLCSRTATAIVFSKLFSSFGAVKFAFGSIVFLHQLPFCINGPSTTDDAA